MLVAIAHGKSKILYEADAVVRNGNDFTVHTFTGSNIQVTNLTKAEADTIEDHFYGLPSTLDFTRSKHGEIKFAI